VGLEDLGGLHSERRVDVVLPAQTSLRDALLADGAARIVVPASGDRLAL